MKLWALAFCLIFLVTASLRAQMMGISSDEFAKADSIAELYPHHSLKDMRLLSTKLTESLKTEEGKFRAIYKWVCSNIDNDFDLFYKNKRQREKLSGEDLTKWNKEFTPHVFKVMV